MRLSSATPQNYLRSLLSSEHWGLVVGAEEPPPAKRTDIAIRVVDGGAGRMEPERYEKKTFITYVGHNVECE